MQSKITTFDNTAEGWERSLYAFLAEKERRSGSRRTVEGYSRMLQHFFGTVGKPPNRVTSLEVFARPLPDGRPTARIRTPPDSDRRSRCDGGAGVPGLDPLDLS